MTPPAAIASLPKLPPLADEGAKLVIYVLESACKLMGGANAWVTRHSGDCSRIVTQHNAACEIDASLNSVLISAAQQAHPRPVMVKTEKREALLCVCLADGEASDGSSYLLGMMFAGPFEFTERLAGMIEGLRCSLQALIRNPPSWQVTEGVNPQELLAVTCSCCRRRHTAEHGWLHWDDFRFLKTGRGSSHTVCESCALALYGDVLQGKI